MKKFIILLLPIFLLTGCGENKNKNKNKNKNNKCERCIRKECK